MLKCSTHKLPVTWLVVFILFTSSFFAAAKDAPRVLILNSYHPQYLWTEQLTKAVESTLQGEIPVENLLVKYLNARRFVDDRDYENLQYQLLEYEFNRFKPDLIIAFDDAAYQLVVKDSKGMFAGIPLVFGGVNIFNPADTEKHPQTTGVVEGEAIQQNIELIVQTQPNIERIVLIGDRTGLGFTLLQESKRIVDSLTANPKYQQVSFDFYDTYDLSALREEFTSPTANTALLLLAVHKDVNNNYFSYDVEVKKISEQLNVPLYGMWGTLIVGNGALGGQTNNASVIGKEVAALALDILNGQPTSSIPVKMKTTYSPVFDYVQMRRFGISAEYLPHGVEIINQPESFFIKHITLLLIFSAFSLLLITIIVMLLILLRQRSAAQKELQHFNLELENRVTQRTEELNQRNSELHLAAEQMKLFAYEDSLTHLGNRRAGSEELSALVQRHMHDEKGLCVALFDLDNFKKINDSFGHETGDIVLAQTAKLMKSITRPLDTAFRWGGEEFMITLPNTSLQNAISVCERLLIEVSLHSFDIEQRVTASIGVTQLQVNDTVDTIINRADQLLYQAKSEGRNRVLFNHIA